MLFKEFITFLVTNDLKKTANFYLNILGLTLYKDQKDCLIFNITKQAKIGFCEHIPIIHEEKSPIITLVSEDVDRIYENIIDENIYIKEKPKVNPKFNIYHFFFKDPNGYTIEIQKFLK